MIHHRHDRPVHCRPAEHRHPASHRFGPVDHRGRQRPSDDLLSAAEIVATLFFAEMRFDPKNPQHPDNDRFVLSKGHAAPMLYAAWAEAGLFPREELLKLRKIEVGPRRAPDAAAAVRRRRHRIARSGHLRRRRHRAQRAAHRIRLPHLRAARRRRDGRRIGVGSGSGRPSTTSSTTCARSSTSTASARARRRSSTTTWTPSPRAGRRSAGTRSSSTATTSPRCWRRSPRRATRGAPTMILAQTLKGKGYR